MAEREESVKGPEEDKQAQEDTQLEARDTPPDISTLNTQLEAAGYTPSPQPPSISTLNQQLDAAGYKPRAEQPQEDTQLKARDTPPSIPTLNQQLDAAGYSPPPQPPSISTLNQQLDAAGYNPQPRAVQPGKSGILLDPKSELPTKPGKYLVPASTRERDDISTEIITAKAGVPLDDQSLSARIELPDEDKTKKNKVPIGPTLDLSHVIKETSDILKTYRTFLSDRKTKQAMAIYYLRKLSSTLEEYFNFQRRLDNFFCQHDIITAEMYCQYTTSLPVYGDYKKIIKDTPTAILLPNMSAAITEADVRQIVVDVTEIVFAGGNYTLTMNKICKNIYSSVVERRGIVQVVANNFPFWFDLLEKEAANNEKQSENMFEILSYILFLNSGINEEPLSLKIPTCGDLSSSD